ncbi:RlmE family RNA methyltransferase [Candidatus Peregrinibacteria bacterium]|nr:RlmE family RNA methyltransferase [Candidatus Peregrinibacteria bacterium]
MPKPYIPNDAWSRKAAAEGYRARSVYKLIELDERFHLLQPGMTVLDLGAAPGSWLQHAAKKIGGKGRAIGLDLTPIVPIGSNVVTHPQDIADLRGVEDILAKEKIERIDLVLSDIAPSTSGIKDVDQWRSVELAQCVFTIAAKHLQSGGRCVVKIFRGADFDELLKWIKQRWCDARIVKVEASRDRSREVYVVATK